MNFLDEVPAIRRIETTKDTLFAMDIVGHVSSADAENLFGLLEAAYALHPQLDVLVRLYDHDGVDWLQIDKDTLEQGKALAARHIKRCATVGEPDWTGNVTGFFSPALPTQLRHFKVEDEAEAWEWLEAQPSEK